jgi:hypothetical protein
MLYLEVPDGRESNSHWIWMLGSPVLMFPVLLKDAFCPLVATLLSPQQPRQKCVQPPAPSHTVCWHLMWTLKDEEKTLKDQDWSKQWLSMTLNFPRGCWKEVVTVTGGFYWHLISEGQGSKYPVKSTARHCHPRRPKHAYWARLDSIIHGNFTLFSIPFGLAWAWASFGQQYIKACWVSEEDFSSQ